MPRRSRRHAARLRVALCTRSWSGYPIYPEVLAAAQEAGRRLQSLGHEVVEASPEFDYAPYLEAQKVIWAAFTTQSLDEACRLSRAADRRHAAADDDARPAYHHGKTLNAARKLISALSVYDQVTRKIGEFPGDVRRAGDADLPDSAGADRHPQSGATGYDHRQDLRGPRAEGNFFSALFNGTGSTCTVLAARPVGAGRLPIGIQFVAAFGREDIGCYASPPCWSRNTSGKSGGHRSTSRTPA